MKEDILLYIYTDVTRRNAYLITNFAKLQNDLLCEKKLFNGGKLFSPLGKNFLLVREILHAS